MMKLKKKPAAKSGAANGTNSQKNYYKKLLTDHKNVLARARGIIALLLEKLENEINSFDESLYENDTENPKSYNFWWGDKESATSIITKLSTILIKIIPLEQDIARAALTKADLEEMESIITRTEALEDDLEIIERYVEKFSSK